MKNENKWVQPAVEGVGAVAVVVLIGFMGIYLTPLALFLYPVGVIVYGIKNGVNQAALAVTAACLIVGLSTGDLISIPVLLILFGPLTVAMVYGMKKRRRPLEVLVTGSLVFFASSMMVFYIADSLTGISIIKQLENAFKETIVIQLEMLEGMGLSNYERDSTRRMLEDAYRYIILILPSILMFMSFVISYVNYIMSVMFLRKFGIGVLQMPWLHRFTVPNNFAPGVLVMFLVLFLGRRLDGAYFETIFMNLLIIVGMVFILQGMAVMNFFMLKWKSNKLARGLAIFLVIAISPLLTAVSLLGGADIVFDFRKTRKKPR